MDMIINHYVILIGVGRPWDSHKLENIGVCPRVGGRVLFSVWKPLIGHMGKTSAETGDTICAVL